MELKARALRPPRGSYFLFGARGTGKSSFVRQAYPGALYIDLLDPATQREYLARPERLAEVVRAQPADRIAVIDEVQKVPELLEVVHTLIEERRTQFVLTGSSARKLKRSGIDLLAGRAALRFLFPYLASELGGQFTLEGALRIGLVPLVVEAPAPDEALRAYVALYIREEVFQEGLVRNMAAFSRFLEAVSFSHGQVLNLAHIARESQVERKSIEGYVSILEDLLIAFRLSVFSRRAKRELIGHSKFYLFDPGVYRTLRPKGPLDLPEAIAGVAFEGLIAQQLRAWLHYRQGDAELYFWRTRGGAEVDFVLYGDLGLVALESKYSARVRSEDLRSLKAFKEDYPEATCNFIYAGHERMLIDGILCLPAGEFLAELRFE
jgi:predicted AAA+ superfamily ATPase